MSTTADIKNGSILNFKNSRMKVVEFQHVKPGKGPAFVRTKLKDIQSGKVIDQTFNAGVKLEFIRVTSSQFQYLYKDATSYIFMDNQTFNQVEVSELMMQDGHKYIKEGENIDLVFDGDDIININLPAKVILKVTQTDPGHRGNTATNATKPAKMETGITVAVPQFVETGEKIRVNTDSGEYMERSN